MFASAFRLAVPEQHRTSISHVSVDQDFVEESDIEVSVQVTLPLDDEEELRTISSCGALMCYLANRE